MELTQAILDKAIKNFKKDHPEETWEAVPQEVRWHYIAKAESADDTKVESTSDSKVEETTQEAESTEEKN